MPKKHQNDPRNTQKRPQNEPKRAKAAISNHKATREPNQDDFKTVLDPPRADFPSSAAVRAHPWGVIWEAKSEPKTMQKRSEN